ncbi:hypothetical protein [Pelagicoccus sp. SDUM812002]|uniref:hypothetical protein n=1 Tax=Pelagicoccus sp. SDUM812002 TaxID=3041266 RepID=UPI00280DC498|nr:hypothetical protein [Pelagicoccus sp. SDUM812002]MDQ8185803.1 hypothetical protein [Pelagicoccus sp. SDUM812002]
MSYEIRETDFRVLRDFAHHLFLLSHWDELSECALLYLNRLLPSDCICWNEWTPAFAFLKHSQVSASHDSTIRSLLPALVENLKYHPVIAEHGWQNLRDIPYQLSDYIDQGALSENPLYTEVYRHLEARYQLAFPFCSTSTTELFLILNRGSHDFTANERHLLKTSGPLLASHVHRLHRKEMAIRKAGIVATIMEQNYGLLNVDKLSLGELFLLKELAAGQNVSDVARHKKVRRDTLSRQLSTAREKLQLDTNKELLSTLRAPYFETTV